MKVLLIFGTRPEAVKLAPVYQALNQSAYLEPLICLTSQHRELVAPVLELFELTPDFDLDVMTPGQSLDQLTARLVAALGDMFTKVQPAAVVVQGDTTSTLCGALSAFYHGVPVAHIEAGLRTGDMRSPFPEEMNRVLTTRLAKWHFAPTAHNQNALLAEGIDPNSIHVTGNPVIDALMQVRGRISAGNYSAITAAVLKRFQRPFILVTGHRRESFGAPFQALCEGLRRLAQAHRDVDLVYPVHLNPQVREPVERLLSDQDNIHLIEPLGYEPFLALMLKCKFIITDSGGVQEEGPALGKPVLVMRDTTERIEAIGGAVRMVGTDPERIFTEGHALLTNPVHYAEMANAHSPYGDGTSAQQIVAVLERSL
jgi:UDP-N-acetylglucosamine 2-epimerase